MQALRRTQQRLLLQVIERAGRGDALAAVNALTSEMGLTAYAPVTDLEQAMLDVWSLSEASNPERLAA
jgi:glutamate dehydrogenase